MLMVRDLGFRTDISDSDASKGYRRCAVFMRYATVDIQHVRDGSSDERCIPLNGSRLNGHSDVSRARNAEMVPSLPLMSPPIQMGRSWLIFRNGVSAIMTERAWQMLQGRLCPLQSHFQGSLLQTVRASNRCAVPTHTFCGDSCDATQASVEAGQRPNSNTDELRMQDKCMAKSSRFPIQPR